MAHHDRLAAARIKRVQAETYLSRSAQGVLDRNTEHCLTGIQFLGVHPSAPRRRSSGDDEASQNDKVLSTAQSIACWISSGEI